MSHRRSHRRSTTPQRKRKRAFVLVSALGATSALLYGCLPNSLDITAELRLSDRSSGNPAQAVPRPEATAAVAPPKPEIPARGSGTFLTAGDTLRPVGEGSPRRYRVQVEDSLDLSPSKTAREVNTVLGDPRGWTTGGHAFQLVASEPADFTIKVASAATVDALCGAAGLDTQGEVNCTVGSTVVVNLKRWMLGSPQFDGPLKEYRALIINHEVGHRLGRGHEGCPGQGKIAPAMMQQIKGLDGCKANAWPYDAQGAYIQGPPVP
ncbi:DUF3152 domain-containing protein [Streptomyces zaomyceticus]|uniref:DUF3152 domain-containing protein n=1 Tax=Streptomyces zaomyceticus TaxID=68286 RepID=UPI0036A8059F